MVRWRETLRVLAIFRVLCPGLSPTGANLRTRADPSARRAFRKPSHDLRTKHMNDPNIHGLALAVDLPDRGRRQQHETSLPACESLIIRLANHLASHRDSEHQPGVVLYLTRFLQALEPLISGTYMCSPGALTFHWALASELIARLSFR